MDKLTEIKLNKRQALIDAGLDPYGRSFDKKDSLHSILLNFEEDKEVQTAGRVSLIRGHGKVFFAHIKDESASIQIYVQLKTLGKEAIELFKKVDTGDILGLQGKLFITKTGEKTIWVYSFQFLSKSTVAFPEKFHGLKDQEIRFRKRYLDLIVNDEVRDRFKKRSLIIKSIRNTLDSWGFLEVETPMMHSIPGGALARPFKTHHNTLDMDLYLRVAPELYLKKLIVGGFEKIYELNRSFRNEGISPRHNPEFTMLELYSAYDDYKKMMILAEELIVPLVQKFTGALTVEWGNHSINFTSPWKRISFKEAIQKYVDIDVDNCSIETLISACTEVPSKDECSRDKLMTVIFEEKVEPLLIDPTFIIDFPSILCPLAKNHYEDSSISERFELFICGQEVANAYSELNDPVEQIDRFEKQKSNRENTESYHIDDEFIEALQYGMPPAGGLGIGIDRLVMLLTGATNIREVILFPQLRKDLS